MASSSFSLRPTSTPIRSINAMEGLLLFQHGLQASGRVASFTKSKPERPEAPETPGEEASYDVH
jgi:hypothetical protein